MRRQTALKRLSIGRRSQKDMLDSSLQCGVFLDKLLCNTHHAVELRLQDPVSFAQTKRPFTRVQQTRKPHSG